MKTNAKKSDTIRQQKTEQSLLKSNQHPANFFSFNQGKSYMLHPCATCQAWMNPSLTSMGQVCVHCRAQARPKVLSHKGAAGQRMKKEKKKYGLHQSVTLVGSCVSDYGTGKHINRGYSLTIQSQAELFYKVSGC